MIEMNAPESRTESSAKTEEARALIMPKKDTQSRKYQLTLNNPLDVEIPESKDSDIMRKCPFTHDEIKERIANLTSIVYWCMADEIGLEGDTPHTHIYFTARAPIRFSTVKKLFPSAHIEGAYNDSKTNRDYIKKEGQWAKSEKRATSLPNTFEEFGEIPSNEKIGQRGELQFIYDMIESGLSTADILKTFPESLRYIDKIEHARQVLIEDEYKNTWRDLQVTYRYGRTDTAKTRSIMEQYGYSNVFRVTDYFHPYDGYKSLSHSVLVFEEFRSSLKIQDMLNYLDGYPCELVARYRNKVATYLKVYITTNIPLEEQYVNIQSESPHTWEAFTRRINTVEHFQNDGTIITYNSTKEYFDRDAAFEPISEVEQQRLPFKD